LGTLTLRETHRILATGASGCPDTPPESKSLPERGAKLPDLPFNQEFYRDAMLQVVIKPDDGIKMIVLGAFRVAAESFREEMSTLQPGELNEPVFPLLALRHIGLQLFNYDIGREFHGFVIELLRKAEGPRRVQTFQRRLPLLALRLNLAKLVANLRVLRSQLGGRLHFIFRSGQIVFLERGKPGLIVTLRRIGVDRLLSSVVSRTDKICVFEDGRHQIRMASQFEPDCGNYHQQYLKVEQGVL
jgi:hypothetical protein